MKSIFVFLTIFTFTASAQNDQLKLTQQVAASLIQVPIECIHQEYPNKLSQVIADSSDLQTPSELHPIFYGCFDWHSSVHGHWLLARMANKFPNSDISMTVRSLLNEQFESSKVDSELQYFLQKYNTSFERTYGWGWYLKLVSELHNSPENKKNNWTSNLQPLTDTIVAYYKNFLPKLVYPIRVGEHTNTAFGLSLALDYARKVKDTVFENLIIDRSLFYYDSDKGCPLGWEPSGSDFISPCLQEAELMSKVLETKEFKKWIKKFLPSLLKKKFALEPGKVIDRTDGKLVHLDGLNFSRAWCLYGLSDILPKQRQHLTDIADEHVATSMEHVIGSDYMGSHWLASFLVYALEKREIIIM